METELTTRRARLVVQTREGPRIHPLSDEPVSIGRSPENTIPLSDPRCSRQHLRIERDDPGWRVVDLGSQNGTHRNGRRVRTSPLTPGDVLLVGGTRIIYEEEGQEAKVSTEEVTMVGAPSPASHATPVEGVSLPLRRLERIAELTRALNFEPEDEHLFEQIIDAAVELTGSERGFLIEVKKEGMEFAAARNIAREDQSKPEFEVSWSIAIRVGTTGESVVAVNAAEDERFRSLESVETLGLRSVLCMPVKSGGRILGVIYVDHRLTKGAYDPAAQEMLEVLADHAGIALTSRRLVDELREQTHRAEKLAGRLQERVKAQDSQIQSMRARMGEEGDDRFRDYRVLVGGSARMDELRHLLQKVAATEFPVLIQGESGTGKELVAQCIHANSPRRRCAFVSLNCAAIPETLLENELFGHARGAFTGADRAKKGLFEAAHSGSLFLDEVSEMSPAMQTRLLRVLQEGEVRPVGGKDPIQVDVRIVAASNRDLASMVKTGEFREDLYYRLRVLPVPVPALRERREDIPELIRHFFGRYVSGDAPSMEPEAMDVLCSYGWPGNVRELENEIKRLIALSGDRVDRAALSRHILEAGEMLVGAESSFHDLNQMVETIETREIEKALRRSAGNKTKASKLLGISRFTLQRKLEKYGIASGLIAT